MLRRLLSCWANSWNCPHSVKRVRRITKSGCSLCRVCPSLRMEQLGSHWTNFHEIWYLNIVRNTVENNQVTLKLNKNNRYFTWRSVYIFYPVYSLPNIVRVVKSRRMRWAGHVARMGEDRGVHRVLVEKPEGKRPLGRPRRRWEDNIKMDLQEVGWGRGDWMELAQDRDGWLSLVTVWNFRVP